MALDVKGKTVPCTGLHIISTIYKPHWIFYTNKNNNSPAFCISIICYPSKTCKLPLMPSFLLFPTPHLFTFHTEQIINEWGEISLGKQLVSALQSPLKNIKQWFSTGVLQGFLKHTIPDYLERDSDLFSLRLSNKKMTTANTTTTIQYERIKIIPIFWPNWQKYIFLIVPQNFSN